MKLSDQFLRFSVIGVAGFAVDVGMLYQMTYLGLDLYSARAVSFLMAASTTWLGNRYFTFGPGRRRKSRLRGEWAAYTAAMTLGGLVNYGVYALLISKIGFFRDQPWVAVAGATGAGLLINFILARRILYRKPD